MTYKQIATPADEPEPSYSRTRDCGVCKEPMGLRVRKTPSGCEVWETEALYKRRMYCSEVCEREAHCNKPYIRAPKAYEANRDCLKCGSKISILNRKGEVMAIGSYMKRNFCSMVCSAEFYNKKRRDAPLESVDIDSLYNGRKYEDDHYEAKRFSQPRFVQLPSQYHVRTSNWDKII